jgi:hypothetical protein
LSSLRPNPSNIRYVIAAIEEIASGLRREGIGWDKALREAAVKVMLKVPDDRTGDWVARIAQRFGRGLTATQVRAGRSADSATTDVGVKVAAPCFRCRAADPRWPRARFFLAPAEAACAAD